MVPIGDYISRQGTLAPALWTGNLEEGDWIDLHDEAQRFFKGEDRLSYRTFADLEDAGDVPMARLLLRRLEGVTGDFCGAAQGHVSRIKSMFGERGVVDAEPGDMSTPEVAEALTGDVGTASDIFSLKVRQDLGTKLL